MIALLFLAALARPPSVAVAAPGVSGFSADRLERIGDAVEGAISRGDLPGAVVLVGRGDRVVFRKAWGNRAPLPAREPMTADTVFELMLELNRELGTSLVIVTHAPEIAARMQRTLVLHDGTLSPA